MAKILRNEECPISQIVTKRKIYPDPVVIKPFFMLNLTEHEISWAHA